MIDAIPLNHILFWQSFNGCSSRILSFSSIHLHCFCLIFEELKKKFLSSRSIITLRTVAVNFLIKADIRTKKKIQLGILLQSFVIFKSDILIPQREHWFSIFMRPMELCDGWWKNWISSVERYNYSCDGKTLTIKN